MSVTYIGELSIQACLPLPVSVLISAMADLQAKLTAMAAFELQLGLPALSIAVQLNLAAQITAALEAALTIGITPPSISAQLEIVIAVVAQLTAQLAIYINLFSLLGSAGVFAYAYDGPTNGFGADMTTALSSGFPGHGSTAHANVLVLGTVSSATWTAMSQVFKTS